jgi:hypothetical protein
MGLTTTDHRRSSWIIERLRQIAALFYQVLQQWPSLPEYLQ